jgi:hypothetical protein
MKKLIFLGSLIMFVPGVTLSDSSSLMKAQPTSVSFSIVQAGNPTPSNAETLVKILEPGSIPRQELRFKPVANTEEITKMTLTMDTTVSLNGEVSPIINNPIIEIFIGVQITQVDPQGDIHGKFSYRDIKVIPRSDTQPEVLEAINSQLQQLKNFQGTFIIDPQGKSKSVKFSVPDTVNSTVKQILEQLSNSLDQLSFPLPSEPIGIGGRWQITNSLTVNGINLNQIATYKLINLKDNVATLDVIVEQRGNSQALNYPGLPENVVIQLLSLNSQGTGTVQVGFNKIMPISSTMQMNSESKTKLTELETKKETIIGTTTAMKINLQAQ